MKLVWVLIYVFSDGVQVATNEVFNTKKECEARVKQLEKEPNKRYCLEILGQP